MKHISILIPKGDSSVVNIMGSFQILMAASEQYKAVYGKALFEIDLVGFDFDTQNVVSHAMIIPTKAINEIKDTNLIIIPAVHADPASVIQDNQPFISFIEEHYKKGANVASLCIGAYLLAATGLLNGMPCSTHWQHAKHLKAMFPEIIIKEEKIITDNNGIITSGGAYAFTNLILYLVEKYGGRELAVFLAKTFMIDLDRTNQSLYFMFSGERGHSDGAVLQVQDFIEKNYANKFTIDQLAEKHHLVKRTLERRFKNATGNSIMTYTQKVRIESAKKNLEMGRKSVTEVMYDCGYNDSKAFRDVFKKYVGVSPLEYRQKYLKRLADKD